jgi:hypothetical protein
LSLVGNHNSGGLVPVVRLASNNQWLIRYSVKKSGLVQTKFPSNDR